MPLDYGATQAISSFSGNAVLICIKEDGSEVRVPIFAAVTTIGRDPSNMVPINDGSVSRFHAKLLFQNGQYALVDLGSANKTHVNGQEIKEAVLQSGSEIRFAAQRFIFQVLQPAASAPPPSYAPPPQPAYAPTPMAVPSMAPAYPPAGSFASVPPPPKKSKPVLLLGGVFLVLLILIAVVVKMSNSSNSSTPTEKSGGTPQGAPSTPASQTPVTPPPTTPTGSAEQTPAGGSAPIAGSPSPPSSPVITPPLPSGPQDIGRLMDEAGNLESSGKLRDARMRYEQVLKIDPTNSRARQHLEDVKRNINDAINLHFKNAKQAFDFLRYDEAIDEWNLVLSLTDPTDSRYADSQKGIQQAQARLKR